MALTANAVFGTKEMLLDNGFDDFLTKPIDIVYLNTIVDKWLPKEKRKLVEKHHEVTKQDTDVGLEIEGLNIKQGLAFSGGTVQNYLKILAVFHKDGHEKIREIRMCLATNNLPLYVIHVHALVSASANIGAISLSEAAKFLETAGKQRDMILIQAKSEQLLADLKTLLDNINVVLAKTEGKEQRCSYDRESLKTQLTQLKTALNDFDSKAISKVTNDLHGATLSDEVDPVIDEILHNILIGDYDQTITLIDSLL